MADDFKPCSVPGCKGNAHYSANGRKGWCGLHYGRWKIHGDPNYQPKEPTQGCAIDGCTGDHFGRGYCHAHHSRLCEEVYGEKPTPEHEVAHGCGNGDLGCVTKRHLRWATTAENHADRILHGTNLQGEDNPNRKLTEEEVRDIRALRGKKTQHQIAAMFGIDQTTVSNVQLRRTWAWM